MEPRKKLKNRPKLGSEKTAAEIEAHRRLAHEDRDPVYPLDESLEKMRKEKGKHS